MSRTFDIVCRDCKQGVWIGQTSHGNDRGGHIYTGEPKTMETLADFLFAHIGHALVFDEDQKLQITIDYEELTSEKHDISPRNASIIEGLDKLEKK